MKRIEFQKKEIPKGFPQEMAKRTLLGRINAITKRLGLNPIKELQEDEDFYFVKLDITDEQVDSLPIGLKKLVCK